MKPQQLVPTLETCRALKEAGFDQDTYFGYHEQGAPSMWSVSAGVSTYETYIAAPMLQEILTQLPEVYPDKLGLLVLEKYDIRYRLDYVAMNGDYRFARDDWKQENAAEAAALLWLSLQEETVSP